MAPYEAGSEAMSSVPEDGFDDSEFTDYLQGNLHGDRAQSKSLIKRRSSNVGESWSRHRSVVSKSSQIVGISTYNAFEDTCAVAYIECARSLLQRIQTDYDEIRNIVTGGAADAWYPAALLGPPASWCGEALCFGSMLPVSTLISSCGFVANQMIVPTLPCNAAAAQLGNDEVVQQTDSHEAGYPSSNPVLECTPLRATTDFSEPTINGQEVHMDVEASPKTSLMFRNIPSCLSRSVFMNVLRSEGFSDHVTFIYIPMNLRSRGNFGYAFVDFDSQKVAERCKEKMEGFMGWTEPSEKPLEVVWSDAQGLDAHVQRYRDSPIMHESVEDEMKPAMFQHGVRIAYPRPTKPIRAPRVRRTV